MRLLQNCLDRYLIQLTERKRDSRREREGVREENKEEEATYRNQLTHTEHILSLMSYEAQTEDISGAHVAPATRLATVTGNRATVEHFKP